MRYAAQLPMIFRPCRPRARSRPLSVYTHDLMSVARRGSVITSLGFYTYRIGARLARRVFKIGTLVMEWCTVGWMCACERVSEPPRPRPPPPARATPAERVPRLARVYTIRSFGARVTLALDAWPCRLLVTTINARTRIVNCFFKHLETHTSLARPKLFRNFL